MVVHPVPHRDVDERHARDLVRSPEVVERLHGAALGGRLREPEQLQVLVLKHKRQRLGERGVRNAGERVVVDVLQREDLLDVVPHLVDGDVEALVVHAVAGRRACADADCRRGGRRPWRGPIRAPDRRRCCSPDSPRAPLRSRVRGEDSGCRACTRRRSDIACARSRRAALRSTCRADGKPLYQMSNGSSVTAEALLDQVGDARDERRRQHLLEHLPARAPRGSAGPRRSGGRCASAPSANRDRAFFDRAERVEDRGVAGVVAFEVRGARALAVFFRRRFHFVRERVPVDGSGCRRPAAGIV